MKLIQVLANVLLYGFFLWLLYRSTLGGWDPWFAFVVLFVLIVAAVTSLLPSLHASKTSPGAYPYED
jgi:hypothetical protein